MRMERREADIHTYRRALADLAYTVPLAAMRVISATMAL